MNYITPRQAELLSILQNKAEYSLLQIIDEMGMLHNGKHSTTLRYNLERLAERELITAIGDIKVRSCRFEITDCGLRSLRDYQRESYVAPSVAPAPKINKMSGQYVPNKTYYYRNNGNINVPSRGMPT